MNDSLAMNMNGCCVWNNIIIVNSLPINIVQLLWLMIVGSVMYIYMYMCIAAYKDLLSIEVVVAKLLSPATHCQNIILVLSEEKEMKVVNHTS